MNTELQTKLARIRTMMSSGGYNAVHVTDLGNLAWLLCGADLVISLTGPAIADAIVTHQEVTVIADDIERGRLEAEELPQGVELVYVPWHDPEARKAELAKRLGTGRVLSDKPAEGCDVRDFWPLRIPLLPEEIARYRALCQETAHIFTDVLTTIAPGITEHELAGRLAEGLRARGMQPAVLLIGSDDRLERYRHPMPKDQRIEQRVMAVACARRHGLYANITRFVSFGAESEARQQAYRDLLAIEQVVLDGTQHGVIVKDLFADLQGAYARHGHDGGWQHHHQGGATGYLTRDFIAQPASERILSTGSAYAWNPSLPGLKVEDTVLLVDDTLEILTEDPRWPLTVVGNRRRPEILNL